MMERGLMRRYAAVLRHREAGFSANAMVVWKVPPERSEEVGEIMNLTRERVRQVETAGLARLQEYRDVDRLKDYVS